MTRGPVQGFVEEVCSGAAEHLCAQARCASFRTEHARGVVLAEAEPVSKRIGHDNFPRIPGGVTNAWPSETIHLVGQFLMEDVEAGHPNQEPRAGTCIPMVFAQMQHRSGAGNLGI
jgi:hypothetical protein